MSNVLGIDIGASFVKAVYIGDTDNLLIPVLNSNFDCMFRVCGVKDSSSAIKPITKDEDRLNLLESGQQVIENVKPLRGESPEGHELEVAVLKEVLEFYRDQSKNRDLSKIDKIVLTHPVSHRPASISALKQIAIDAGLPENKLDTIEEPVALGIFAKHLRPEISTSLLIIDAGHYTTDLVIVRFEGNQPTVESTNYLSVRLGVAELCHRLGRSLWIKSQMVGGLTGISEQPFSEAGPEANNPLIQQMSGWAENSIIKSIGLRFFDPDHYTSLDLHHINNLGQTGKWRDKVSTVNYFYDITAARKENLDLFYPHHNTRLVTQIHQENYREVIRPIIEVLCASTLAVLFDNSEINRLQLAIGGGMSLIPEVSEAINRITNIHGIQNPVELSYNYPGLDPLAPGSLLAIAAGAALAATQNFKRIDTLSDTIGIFVHYEFSDALDYLDKENVLREDFDPESEAHLSEIYARQMENGVIIVPIHRVLAYRGQQLPLKIEFPDDLVILSNSATLNLTRCGDQVNNVRAISPGAFASGATVAQIHIQRLEDDETRLRLFLEVTRNDVWRLIIEDSLGQPILDHNVEFKLTGRVV